jgi:hypothetical protein
MADISRGVHHRSAPGGAFFFVWLEAAMQFAARLSFHPDSVAAHAINAGLQSSARHE